MELRELLGLAEALKDQVVAWRRDFHQHPETGYEEIRTSSIVAEHLKSLGLDVQTGIGKTGVVGILRGEEPGPTIGLRADMDALPIQDQKEVAYRSQHPGIGHLCGHDAHTGMLMGAAQLLTSLGKPKKGNIKFIFQPAEEGLAGAKAMMVDGVLEEPHVDAMAGIHVFPSLPTGRITVTKGISFAAADRLVIKIIGKGGHAARPHETVDAIAISAQVISGLQHISSRLVDPLEPVVVTIGKIQGGSIGTAIASEVELIGTVRTLSPSLRAKMPELIENIVSGVTRSLGAEYELEYSMGYPAVLNDEDMVDFVIRTSEKLFGEKRWNYAKPSMGGEDFAFYSHSVPSVFFRLGVSNGQEETLYPLHHSMFDLDEEALSYGVAMHAAIALSYLGNSTGEKDR
ncbi:amidohydrolase [Paenibacillus hemerocallicola]|uniref:Amidohydrolase n=1 Tax=Paenibacillus hemerocallicola TaxID=1172614 RepID=A0A5C4T3Z9_9BACL|nr:amidohydrolase [Paenibacillus hemerocallicola]TNJ63616.1 amidohydrolase [Paenibacillus hemerocallicola]